MRQASFSALRSLARVRTSESQWVKSIGDVRSLFGRAGGPGGSTAIVTREDAAMLRVYGDILSGNCYKVRLLMIQLGLAHEWIYTDIRTGVTREADFLSKNPNGRIPLLEYAPGKYLAESGAILWYLAEGTPYLPDEKLERAQALQWMFFEQYSHEPYIATSRYYITFLGQPEKYADEIARRVKPGYAALGVMERHLAANEYFAGGRYSIADIALYAYTHVAHEGGYDLKGYPAVRSWLGRVQGQSKYVGMEIGNK